VAGIIAADAGNGIGIIGVAPEVKLLALRACWPAQAKSVCSSFTLAKALTFALERAPQVVNLSLAGPQDPLLERCSSSSLPAASRSSPRVAAPSAIPFPRPCPRSSP
jgi:subtilisin family serine protease